MPKKEWVVQALENLRQSLAPIPHEVNELDWKASLSDHRDRLTEHLIAFGNHANGGFLVFGVNNDATHKKQLQIRGVFMLALRPN